MLFSPLFVSPEFGPVRWVDLLIESSLKASMLIGIAALAATCLRRASAAVRHWVWSTAMAAMLFLPAAVLLLPAWRVDVASLRPTPTHEATPGTVDERPHRTAPAVRASEVGSRANADALTGATDSGRPTDAVAVPGASDRANQAPSAGDALRAAVVAALRSTARIAASWQEGFATALPWVWLAGFLLAIVPFVLGRVRLAALGRDSRRATEREWKITLQDAARAVRLTRPVELLLSDRVAMPLTWGTLRPCVLMPEASMAWPAERRRAVLLHELAHVQRLDCLTQILAQVACAVFWFHPLVWFASRRLRSEREQACDDVVLRAETRASDYAEHLLAVVRTLRSSGVPALGAVAFARPSQLEGRLLALLDDRRSRGALSSAQATRIALLVLALVLPLGALEIAAAPARAGARAAHKDAGASEVVRPPATVTNLDEGWGWAGKEAARRDADEYWVAWMLPGGAGEGGLLCDSGGLDLSTLKEDYDGPKLADVLAKVEPDGMHEDGRELVVLIHAGARGRGESRIDRMRAQTVRLPSDLGNQPLFWLGRSDDRESVEWLAQLRERVSAEGMRSQAVDIIGIHRDAAVVVPFLRQILDSRESEETRAQAAEGLGHHPGRESLELLTRTARTDRSTHVRREAIEALGDLDMDQATTVLFEIAKSKDVDPDLRREAIESLGDNAVERGTVDELDELAGLHPSKHASPPAQPLQPLQPHQPMPPQPPVDVYGRTGGGRAPDARGHSILDEEDAGETDADRDADQDGADREDEKDNGDQAAVDLQRQAVESLGRQPEDVGLPRLLKIVRTHPSMDVRLSAVESIGRYGSEAAFAALSDLSWKGVSVEIQQEAVESMGQYPAPKAVPRLSEIARSSGESNVRMEAAETLGQFSTKESVAALDELVQNGVDTDVRRTAVEALGRQPAESSVQRLSAIAKTHPDPEVRRAAIETLSRVDPDQALPVIEEILKSKPKKSR